MIINEQSHEFVDRFNDKLITNFYTQASKGIESQCVELLFHMEDDTLNDCMDDNDMKINLTVEEYKQFLLSQIRDLHKYMCEKEIKK